MIIDTVKNRIHIQEQVDSWQDAIKIAAKPLLNDGCIEASYVDAMIKNITQNGSYIVLIPGFALPHARPEKGAKETGVSCLKLNQPVMFPDDMEVKIIMALAARDADTHIDALTELSDLLLDDDKMEQFFKCSTEQEILEILK